MAHPWPKTKRPSPQGEPLCLIAGVYPRIACQAAAWPGGGVRTARWITFDQLSSDTRCA